MRFALATMLAAGLVLTSTARAQDTARLIDLTKQVARGAETIKERQNQPTERPRKVGERILKSLLNDDSDRRTVDPVFDRFDAAADELVNIAIDLDRHTVRGREGRSAEDERNFIRQFRNVEKLAMDVDRTLPGSSARGIFTDDVKPALLDIRRALPTLSAYREHQERRDFYRRDSDRM